MTLIVGMKVPDGLVIATDSLVTIQVTKPIKISGSLKCEKCAHEQNTQIEVPLQLPSSISPTAQKLFSLIGKFGIGTYGNGVVNGQSMYSHFKIIEKVARDQELKKLSGIVELIKSYFIEQLKKEIEKRNIQIPPDVFPFGFKIAGYEDNDQNSGEIVTLQIGLESEIEKVNGFGCTVGGDPHIVQMLWSKLKMPDGKEVPVAQPIWDLVTLQDAIDYSEFLIRTTADYQKFANMIPTVGGPIDIALITTHTGFKWIRHKRLSELLDEGDI